MYSQNNEDKIIADYFGDEIGCLVDIGANDGKTFSNSLLLIEKGWYAHLLEPNQKSWQAIRGLHGDNGKVAAYCLGISDQDGVLPFYESGSHVTPEDHSLLSTLHSQEAARWGNTATFEKTEAVFMTWDNWLTNCYADLSNGVFDFISIDAEGEDWSILRQIDLTAHKCRALCIEWNSNVDLVEQYIQYALRHGLRELYRNGENIIFVA